MKGAFGCNGAVDDHGEAIVIIQVSDQILVWPISAARQAAGLLMEKAEAAEKLAGKSRIIVPELAV